MEVDDVSGQTALFTLAGPASDELVTRLGAGQLVGREQGAHAIFGVGQQPVVACVGEEIGQPGYSFLASEGVAADLWQQFLALVSPRAFTAHAIAGTITGSFDVILLLPP